MHTNQAVCWKNGIVMPAADASVSVLDHGLLYGDGVFEGIRFYRGRAFLLREHLERLRDSACAIALDIPYNDTELTKAVQQTVAAFGVPEGYLRLIVTRDIGSLGIDPRHCAQPTVLIIADHLQMVPEQQRRSGARRARSAHQKPELSEPYPGTYRSEPGRG